MTVGEYSQYTVTEGEYTVTEGEYRVSTRTDWL